MPRASASDLLARFSGQISLAHEIARDVRPLEWAELDAVLPDGGLPRGIVELRAAHALGGATAIALAAVRAIHRRDARAWCAWIDPNSTLYSPGIAMADVDLNRLVVIRPERTNLFRIATKVLRSQAFELLILDVDPLPSALGALGPNRARGPALDVAVRKLAVLAGETGSTVVLLTDATIARPAPLPTALRLELARTRHAIEARVAKERHGRIGLARTVPINTRPRLVLAS